MKNIEIVSTILFSIIGIGKCIYEYTKKLRWDRTKFLSEQMDHFFKDPEIKKVLTILDWNSAKIEFNGEFIKYNDSTIISALSTHDIKSSFSPEEKYIRSLFDNFFDRLSIFQIWMDTGLIDRSDTKKFLKYYLEIISGKRKSKSNEFVLTLKKYIDFYGFEINYI